MNPPELNVEIDSTTPEEWSHLLDLFADANLYQTWAYGEVSWGRGALSHLILRDGKNVLAIAQLQIVRMGGLKCGVAYLRWGPLFDSKRSGFDPETVSQMAEALRKEYVNKRGLFLRIFPNSIKGSTRAEIFRSAFKFFTEEAFNSGQTSRTILLDLSPSLKELRTQLDGKWRNQLNRAEKNELSIVEGDDSTSLGAFVEIYREMIARKHIDPSAEVFAIERIQRELPLSQRLRVLLCFRAGRPVAGLVGTALGNTGIYLHGATSDDGMKTKGAYLLQWRLIQWLKERGVTYYNLGGINPKSNPGVYHFKSGLMGADVLYTQPLFCCSNPFSWAIAAIGGSAIVKNAKKLKARFRS